MTTEYQEVLDFWFGDMNEEVPLSDRNALWFQGNTETDALIARRFQHLVSLAGTGALSAWSETPKGTLALIILLDQFSRNIYRGLSAAFRYDALALALCKRGLAKNQDLQLSPIERVFFYLPLEHSEALEDQEEAVFRFERLRQAVTPVNSEMFDGFYQYAVSHHEVVKRFGRFPHRNAVYGRLSTEEELHWLLDGGQRFGQ
ncbi:DUF924 family protein [Photobacterium aphoticum]|uniref:Membrane protein n=1 Tax=Photobacterium aphoticum TaxID=754436 RepID=A0A0J1GKS7_9GAMM|nr:DUF924 family protein [Photobacterium aphoticum]KLV00074.1 membrane protein [Photobacterium aphoticum]PSU55880.1 DUF924 domain-containing protein [Photobacterium aphoticum]GHA48557.1 hypothetical protein GCM10007086_22910 [Photobacterium aphoticum]